MKLLKVKKPGRCPVIRCRKKPRNLRDHPTSCQLCGSHAKEQWRLKNPMHAAYDNVRASARQRKIPFTLTFDHFRSVVEPTRYMDDKGHHRYSLHIDRIEEHLGYADGNIQVITCTENVSKENRRRYVDAKLNREEDDSGDPF